MPSWRPWRSRPREPGADPAGARRAMVEHQLRDRGVHDEAVLAAMAAVPREAFVPAERAGRAYDDAALPIDCGQTISQPLVVARMAELLELGPADRVLEVGAGSGYAAAVLSRLAAGVWAVERHGPLAEEAAARLARLGFATVHVRHGDGRLGWPEEAPFDAITVAAGGPEVPPALLDQLAPGGRLVMPVGPARGTQELVRVRRAPDGSLASERLEPVRFVPLTEGESGGRREPGERRRAPGAGPAEPGGAGS